MRPVVNPMAFAGKNVDTLISWWEVSGCCWLSLGKEKESKEVLHQKPCDCFGHWQIFMVTVICMDARNLYANTRWAVVKFEKVCCKLKAETVRLQVKVKKLKSESFAFFCLTSEIKCAVFILKQFDFLVCITLLKVSLWLSKCLQRRANYERLHQPEDISGAALYASLQLIHFATAKQPLAKQSENSLFSLVTGGCQANRSLSLPH